MGQTHYSGPIVSQDGFKVGSKEIADENAILYSNEIEVAPLNSPSFTGPVTSQDGYESPKAKITVEGGLAVKLTNKTGAASAKGSVVTLDTTTDNAVKMQTTEFDAVGAFYESGIADGEECWVVVSGIAEVLLKDGTASVHGYWVVAADTDGRANASQPVPHPNNTLTEHTLHFKEIGHCLETKDAGTDVLCKILMHFN